MAPKYAIGIDLGTTNSALAYVELESTDPHTEILTVEQVDGAERVRSLAMLPSAIYLPPPTERDGRYVPPFSEAAHAAKEVVGVFARSQAATQPGRVVQSAKSWLCATQLDPHSESLPWGSDEPELARLSPVRASAAILRHLREWWDCRFAAADPRASFVAQRICITVPASFDEAAQQLTMEAATLAGYPANVALLEEPQAAFYFWLEEQRRLGGVAALPERGGEPSTVLVVDIGGGTTDLTLFEAHPPEGGGVPRITRREVSEHLLLGGDNIDLLLAKRMEERLSEGARLGKVAWWQLVAQCRALKERALTASAEGESPSEAWHVSVGGSGSRLLQASRSAAIQSDELRSLLLEGFFPVVAADARPVQPPTGLRELGLPYASDSAVSRHLAAFLRSRRVDAVLFNGGSLKPSFLQERLLQQFALWQGDRPHLLNNPDMDLAVARGAAWFGALRERPSEQIAGGYPHSLYLKVRNKGGGEQLVCVLPKGTASGTAHLIPDRRFRLKVNQPVSFELFRSSSSDGPEESDPLGAVVNLTDRPAHALPPMQTRLESNARKEREIEVSLRTELSETGLFRIFCVPVPPAAGAPSSERSYELHFNVRREQVAADELSEESREPLGVSVDQARAALDKITRLFGKAAPQEDAEHGPKELLRELERTLGSEKSAWQSGLLRLLWTALAPGITKRSRSLAHELCWLRLAGYLLRPGYGAEHDEFRIAELWRAFEVGLFFKRERSVWSEWWILWRRVAGGLTASMQEQLFDAVWPTIRDEREPSAEAIRLVGALERLSRERKERASALLLKRVPEARALREVMLLTLARIGSRVPLYGGVDCVVPPEWISHWFETLSLHDWSSESWRACRVVFAYSCRKVDSRELDVDETLRARVITKLTTCGADKKLFLPLREFVPPDNAFKTALFGEALPAGLVVV